jgi:hypothetical protein
MRADGYRFADDPAEPTGVPASRPSTDHSSVPLEQWDEQIRRQRNRPKRRRQPATRPPAEPHRDRDGLIDDYAGGRGMGLSRFPPGLQ